MQINGCSFCESENPLYKNILSEKNLLLPERGEAELHILDTWSEFQKPSQTAAKRGKAELRILDIKTTWSDFQKANQTTPEQGKAELHRLNFKTTWS